MTHSNQLKKFIAAFCVGSVSEVIAVVLMIGAAAVLLGWAFGVQLLKSLFAGFISMKPNTALCFLWLGAGLFWAQSKRLTRPTGKLIVTICAIFVLIISIATLVEYVFHVDLGIDQGLFADDDRFVPGGYYGRMAVTTAIDFFLLGFALLLLQFRQTIIVYAAQSACFAAAIIALFSLVSYCYGTELITFNAYFYSVMAVHTIILFLLASLGILLCIPSSGWMRHINADLMGGRILRRFAPIAIVIPIASGFIVLQLQKLFPFGFAFGVALLAVMSLSIMIIYVFRFALLLNSSEQKRRDVSGLLSEASVLSRQIVASVEEGIIVYGRDLRYKQWNAFMEKITGLEAQQVLGRHPVEVFPFLKDAGVLQRLERALKGEAVSPVEFEYHISSTGKRGWCLDVSSGLRDENGNIIGVIGVVHDISEQRERDQKLRLSEQSSIKEANKFKVLFELTLNMSAGKSLDENLGFIVERSRFVLGIDSVHIALCDKEHQVLRMHLVSGVKTEAYKKISLPLGKGLGGLVMREQRGVIASRYFLDDDIEHCVDDIVAAEGFVSYMAAPIQTKGKAYGVVYAANRSPKNFVQDDLDALTMFASLAAIELSRAEILSELKAEQENVVRYMDVAAVILLVLGSDGRVVRINRKGCEILGCKEEEVVGKVWSDNFLPGRVRPVMEAILERVRNNDVVDSEYYESPVSVGYGKERLIAWRNVFLRNDDNKINGILCSGEDITEQRAAAEQLAFKNILLSVQAEAANDGILIIDRDERIILINRRFLELMNLSKELAEQGMDGPVMLAVMDRVVDPKEYWKKVRYLYEHREEKSIDEIVLKDGKVLDRFTSPMLGENGRYYGRVWYFHDSTARKKAAEDLKRAYEDLKSVQAQLVQSEKMASVGQLAAGVAHEINNPAAFVLGNLDALKQYIDGLVMLIAKYTAMEQYLKENSDEKARQLLAEINQVKDQRQIEAVLQDLPSLTDQSIDGVRRIKKIVADMRSFVHSDEGKRQQADVRELIDAALNIVWNEIKFKVQIVKEYAEVPLVPCYPQLLTQVFLNLLINAAQAMTDKGQVVIRTCVEGEALIVMISDTGCGMSEEVMQRIFEPFFTTKPVGQGTGLGLSLAYNIIKQHRGEIGVSSRPGEGSLFTIRLPLKG